MSRAHLQPSLALTVLIAAGLVVGYFATLPPQAALGACTNNTINGTAQDDFIVGIIDRASTINVGGGQDYVLARNCGDDVYGGAAGDRLEGESGNDHVHGQDAGETLTNCGDLACGQVVGGTDNDRVYGEHGNDNVDDSTGNGDQDDLFGGQDNDILDSLDSDGQDIVNGGPPSGVDETDQCSRVDNGDSTADCYTVG